MKAFELATFKYGLDTRRDVLTSQPGTLYTLENGHINPGGEIEKRKAFVEYADLSIFDNVGASITALSYAGGVVSGTTASAHGLSAGDWIKISGANESGYNGEWQLTSASGSSFTYTYTTTPSATPATGTIVFGDLGCFGLEVTDAGLLTFGSALANGTTPSQSQPVLEAAMPSGITYQQLKHPSIVNDTSVTYVRTRHRLTKVVFSTNFNGKAFVIAQFSDGRRFLYYDGSLVQHSANGLVMTDRLTLADLADDLDRQLEAIGWTADANVDENGTTENGSVIAKSPTGDYFTAIPSETSSAGQIGVKFITKDVASTTAALAYAGFQITNYTGTWQLAILNDSDASTIVADLTGGAVTGVTDISTTCAAIARAINDLSYVHNYTALATSTDVWVYAPPGGDVTAPALRLRVTYTTGTVGVVGTSPGSLVLSTDVTNPAGTYTAQRGENFNEKLKGDVTCSVAGGTAPYSFAWSAVNTVNLNIKILNSTSPKATFVVFDPDGDIRAPSVPVNLPFTGTFRCTVTDSGTPVVSATIDIVVNLVLIVL